MKPAVSVIVPVYKVERYIEQCARSLFGQTMEDLEFIFVDDCTPDASMAILERVLDDYPARRSRVKILHNEVNRGLPYTRSRGVGMASGEYIIHCDSDDWVEPDMYEKLYTKASEGHLDMVICSMRWVYPDHTEPIHGVTRSDDIVESLLYMDILHYLHNKLVARRIYDNPFSWPVNNMCEDTGLIIQLASYCRSWGFVEEELCNYRYSPDSISAAGNSLEKVGQLRANVDLAISFLEGRGLGEKFARGIMHLKCWAKIAAFGLPRRYYVRMYPEGNLPFFFDRRFSLSLRLGHLTKLLGVHGISKPFVRKR